MSSFKSKLGKLITPFKKPSVISRLKDLENVIYNYIKKHRNDPGFDEAEYYVYRSPLSVFFKYLKVKPVHIRPHINKPSFIFYTYCIYANEFLYDGKSEVDNEYTAIRYYTGNWADHIKTFHGVLYRQKQRLCLARNEDDYGAKYWKEELINNMKHFAIHDKPYAGIMPIAAKAIVYLLAENFNKLSFILENKQYILFDLARDGYLIDTLKYFMHSGIDEEGNLIVNKTTFEIVMGFSYDTLIEENEKFQNELRDVIYRCSNLLLSKEHENKLMEESDLIFSSSAVEVPEEIIILAKKLEKIHSQVSISNESSGYHLSIPDPELLEKDGIKELSSRHLSINAEMFLGIGRYNIDNYPTAKNRELYTKFYSKNKEVPCAVSMKTGKYYRVRDLLTMKPIDQRGLDYNTNVRSHIIDITGTSNNLIDDGTGTLVPLWCGKTKPIVELPDSHPAVIYLKERGFDIRKLQDHLDVSYCEEAEPEDRSKGRYYSRLINGMRNTPAGRIILPIWIDGHRVGYQCRIIDRKIGNNYFVWDGVNYLPIIINGNNLYPPSDKFPKGFSPHKYMNALGSKRNLMLMGYDQAVKWNKERHHNKDDTFCILVEGPLDAAKIGPPAIAILGKSLSPMQADLIKSKFSKVIVVADNDTAGQEAKKCIYERMHPFPVDEVTVLGGKDAGDLSYEEAKKLVSTSSFYKI